MSTAYFGSEGGTFYWPLNNLCLYFRSSFVCLTERSHYIMPAAIVPDRAGIGATGFVRGLASRDIK